MFRLTARYQFILRKYKYKKFELFLQFVLNIKFTCLCLKIIIGLRHLLLTNNKRLRWSRGSVLAFGTQVREFKPGRSLSIFQGEKNSQHAFLWRGSKAVCPMSYIYGM